MDPYQFISENIESVAQLKALVLLWNSRPVGWTPEDLSSRLYVPPEQALGIMRRLSRLKFISKIPEHPKRFHYFQLSAECDEMLDQIELVYRQDLVRISNLIHSKPTVAFEDPVPRSSNAEDNTTVRLRVFP
jgi:sugar-specific transcriptional regulator TrmB